jgi:arylsulfatase A
MYRRDFMKMMAAAATFGVFEMSNPLPKNKPNILFVLMDDLGWKDLGCYGGNFIETPVADCLAKEGTLFTQAYASPVCSPTRVSLLTGQNAARHGIWEVIGVNDRPYARMKSPPLVLQIKEDIETYADILNRKGYVCGIIGKWHAGRTPDAHGFQKIDKSIKDPQLKKYAQENEQNEVGLITANAIEYLRQNKEKPFLLCVSHHAVHAPLTARKDLISKYNEKLRKTGMTDVHPTYAAMVEMGDESLGMLVNELKVLGLERNTVVVFYSDNGGLINDMYLQEPTPLATRILPLRNQKGSLYEGGIRVPLIVKWPGKIKPGTICKEMVHSFDLFSTFVEIGGGIVPEKQKTDGLSLVPLLTQEKKSLERQALYWHFPTCMWTRSPMGAIRKGRYKLIEHYEDGSIELFDLEDDIGESINLVSQKSVKARELLDDLQSWRTSMGAEMPIPNPDYDPVRAMELGYHKFLETN